MNLLQISMLTWQYNSRKYEKWQIIEMSADTIPLPFKRSSGPDEALYNLDVNGILAFRSWQ
jgi:hypothetical protein